MKLSKLVALTPHGTFCVLYLSMLDLGPGPCRFGHLFSLGYYGDIEAWLCLLLSVSGMEHLIH